MNKQDYVSLQIILDRAAEINRMFKTGRINLMMDIEFTNDVIPLDLAALASADDLNFAHDVFGIHKNFNRETKTLMNGFVPRYASKQT